MVSLFALILAGPSLVPWPRSVVVDAGTLTMKKPILAVTSPALVPLARILAEEIRLKTGIKPEFDQKPASASIVLKLHPGGDPESYRIEVGKSVTVSAPTYKGLAWGTTTLLQALKTQDRQLQIPNLTIDDQPAKPYRGLLIDVARRFHGRRHQS